MAKVKTSTATDNLAPSFVKVRLIPLTNFSFVKLKGYNSSTERFISYWD